MKRAWSGSFLLYHHFPAALGVQQNGGYLDFMGNVNFMLWFLIDSQLLPPLHPYSVALFVHFASRIWQRQAEEKSSVAELCRWTIGWVHFHTSD